MRARERALDPGSAPIPPGPHLIAAGVGKGLPGGSRAHMWEITAEPNSEHLTSFAPSMRRAKS
jgi:hypothetical protein